MNFTTISRCILALQYLERESERRREIEIEISVPSPGFQIPIFTAISMSTNPDHSELQNGSPEPQSEHSAAAAAAAEPPTDGPDLQKPDPSDTDAHPPDAERSEQVRPEIAEASNSAPEGEISSELSDADSRAAQPNQEAESDLKAGDNAEGNRTFTMRELLNELKNGDASVNDGRETGTPHRLVNCSVDVLE